jgi:large subunit ribosomal protein L24
MRKNVYYKTDRGQRLGASRHATKASREAIHVTKGDVVRVMRGDDKGKEGKVLQVYPKTGRIKVDGVNIVKKHRKARRPEETSGIIEMAAPFHASNVMLLDAKTGRPTRVKARIDADGTKERVGVKSGEVIQRSR